MQDLKIIFVDQNTLNFFKERILPTQKKENLLILTNRKSIEEKLKLQNLNVIYIFDYSIGNPWKSALDFLNTLQSKKIDNRNLLEIFDFEGISIWHMLPSYSCPAAQRIIALFNLITKIIEQRKPAEIIVMSCSRYYKVVSFSRDKLLPQKIIKLIAEKQGIKIKEVKFNPHTLKEKIIFRNFYSSISIALLRFVFRILKRKITEKIYLLLRKQDTSFSNNKKKKILFVSASVFWRRGYNFFNNKFERINTIDYPIIYKLKDEFNTLCIETQYLDKNNTALKEKFRQPFTKWKTFEGYFSFSILWVSLRKYLKFLKKLKGHLEAIKKELLVYQGVNLYPVFEPEIRSSIKNIFCCLIYIETAKKIIKKEKPFCIFLAYETGPYERAFIYNSKQKGIPTLGLQHGFASYDTNPDYARDYSSNSAQALLPSCMLVYGDVMKRLLIKNGYPEEGIKVVGSQGYDFYRVLLNNKKQIKKGLLKRYNIPEDKKIILFISTSPWEGLNEAGLKYHIQALYQYFAEHPEYFLVSKLHPSENRQWHEVVLRRRKGLEKRCLIVKNEASIGEFLLLSEIAIMYGSTAGCEAMMLGVPLISINFTNYRGWLAYVQEGVIPTARNEQDLEYYLTHYTSSSGLYLADKPKLQGFLKKNFANYSEFQAASRIADIVRSL